VLSRAILLLVSALISGVLSAGAWAQESWDPRLTNPSPLAGDFELPMPCGGAMVFRRVDTATAPHWIDDRAITLGDSDERFGYSEFVRREYLAGSLSDARADTRFYYLGKYEVTKDQYAAVMAESCPRPKLAGRVPASGLSWFEAIEFTRKYNEWLLTNAKESVPSEGGKPGFLRLPLETEWEFAARGGQAVDEVAFRQRLFPLDGELRDHAWFQSSSSAGGLLRPVGKLKPNPLGLFDVLGNVEELMFEPFRMNRVGRLHGQAGGFIARGGSFRTAESQIRNSLRTEYAYFNGRTGAATKLDTLGIRLVIASPISVSLERLEAFAESWRRASRFRVETETFDPIAALDEVGQRLSEVELREILKEVKVRVQQEISERNRIEGRALHSAIFTASVLIQNIRSHDRRMGGFTELIASSETLIELSQKRRDSAGEALYLKQQQRAESSYDRSVEKRQANLTVYLNQLFQTAQDYTEEEHREQLELFVQSISQGSLASYARFARLYVGQSIAYKADGNADREHFLDQILRD